MYRRYWDEFPRYERTSPKEVKGGIKASSGRGDFAKNWWAKRWIQVLESFNIGARLSRGKTYARKGQVVSIEIEKGEVTAKVQGSRPKPYKVSISMKTLSPSDWSKLAGAISQQALYSSNLLAGSMPEDIEEVFKQAGLSLFPLKAKDLKTECSCPDWSNPCKHIAAVFYLLGEEFDRDPFLIFKLRGINRDELLKMILENAAEIGSTPVEGETNINIKPVLPPEPLPTDYKQFWLGSEIHNVILGEVSIPQIIAALPKRLGNLPFWRGEKSLTEGLSESYHNASLEGWKIYLVK